MNIKDYIDADKLRSHIENEYVTARPHPTMPLVILCYSRKTVYENLWDDVTTRTRGLVVNSATGEIVARPFEKFFNLGTHDRPETWLSNLPAEAPEITEKLDGSLGTLYSYGGEVGIASKGSFQSEHAHWATGYYAAHHKDAVWPVGWTPVFEMICESVQQHVVRYGSDDKLVLTAMVNNETGEEMDHDNLCIWAAGNLIEVVDKFNKRVGDVLTEDRKNREGYVLTWHRTGQVPLKLKVKHESFLALQKVAHNATPKKILDMLVEGNNEIVNQWAADDNGEVGEFVAGWLAEFRRRYGFTLLEATRMAQHAEMRYPTRKEIARFLLSLEGKRHLAPLAFAFVDRKSKEKIGNIAWKIVQKTFKDTHAPFITEAEESE